MAILPRFSNRDFLAGKWGVKDVEDCLQAAKNLSGDIDTARVVIRGHSSGGYAVLSALSFGPEQKSFYAAATSSCGISNLRLLAQWTHKFENSYMQKLLGGTIEDIPDVYDKERSPVYHADKIASPLLVRAPDHKKISVWHLLTMFRRSCRAQMIKWYLPSRRRQSLKVYGRMEER